MKKRVGYFFLSLILFCHAAFAKITASVNSDVIGVGEKLVLSITSDEDMSVRPDLSVLKNLFNVTSTSVSNQTYIYNGQITNEITWQFTLLPLKKGKIIIEPISVGAQKTNPVEIIVTDGTAQNAKKDYQTSEPLYKLETQVLSPNKAPFIQQQINYAVRFIDDGQVQIEGLSFDNTEDFIITQIGKPKTEKTADGKRMITFFYALFAQKSGVLDLPTAHLQGFLYEKPDMDSFFHGGFFNIKMPSVFGVQEPLTITSETKQINILPVPKEYTSEWWMPASDVSLSASFVDLLPTLHVGDVFKRQIVLKAVGLSGKQLPEPETFSNNDLKKYEEQPVTETSTDGSNVIGELKISDVYIPQKAGMITFPKMKVNWFDVKTGEIKEAVLDEQTLIVKPNLYLKESKEDMKALPEQKENVKNEAIDKSEFNQYLFTTAAFLLGMFFCYMLLKPKKNEIKKARIISEKDIFSKSKKNDFRSLRDKLILWTKTHYPDKVVSNLRDVANIFDDEDLREHLDELSNVLYSENKNKSFNLRAFKKAFKRAVKKKRVSEKQRQTPIPPLYS